MILKINVDSVVDLITNSSSELFVFKENTKQYVIDLINELYPDWRTEYEEPVSLLEATDRQIFYYISYAGNRSSASPINGFTFDEVYCYKYGSRFPFVRSDFPESIGREEFVRRHDPDNKMFLLFSKDYNPNWEKQELLMDIAERYHLG